MSLLLSALLVLVCADLPAETLTLFTSCLTCQDDPGAEKENASVLQHNTSLSGSRNGDENLIDNPYLRPVKKPKIRRKK